MNSLEQLNTFGQSSIVFEDPQATPTFGTFVDDGLPIKYGFATEDSFYTIGDHPFGGDFVGAQGLDNTTNNWIQVEIAVTGGTAGQGSEYFFDVPTLKRNITYTIQNDTVTYNYIQTNVDMHYMINNTKVYLKNAPTELSATPTATVIAINVKWDQSVVPQPNIKTQRTSLTVTQLPELANTGNRTYISGQFNSIFNSNPIEILDENFYSPEFDDVEYEDGMPIVPEEYAITLTTNLGFFKETGAAFPYPSTVTHIGSKDEIRSAVQSTIYVPALGSTATATVSYYLEVPSRSYNSGSHAYPVNWHRTAEGSFDITGITRTTPASWEGEFEDTSVTIIEEMRLFSKADVLVVGGGGGGGAISTRSQLTANELGLIGGGGGSGCFLELQGTDLLQQGVTGQQITMVKGTGGVGANWDTVTRPGDGTNSELLLNGVQKVVAPGGGRGGSSYNAPNQPYGLGTPTSAFVEFNGSPGGQGGGAAGSNNNMPGYAPTLGGAGGIGVVNSLTSSGITQSWTYNGVNGTFASYGNPSQAYLAGGGGGSPTTGGDSTIPTGPTIITQVIDIGTQFCEQAPPGGRSITEFNPTQYTGSGGKGMGYQYNTSAPRPYWNGQDGHDGFVKIRIRAA